MQTHGTACRCQQTSRTHSQGLNLQPAGSCHVASRCSRQRHANVSLAASREALLYDFHDQLIPYEQAWSWQKQRVAELCSADTSDRRDTVFLLQHPPVYTLGAGSSEAHVKFDLHNPPHPLYRTERGGEVTYHGPGQLVMYPILDLTQHTQDLHWYLRGLEEVIIRALADTSGLTATRIQGLTGVWVDGHKLAAIGVRARKWVTYHGLALNVSTVLEPFTLITPCGIANRPVGSVKTAVERVVQQQQQQQQQDLGRSVALSQAMHMDSDVESFVASSDAGSTKHSSSSSSSSTLADSKQPPQQQSQQQQDLYSVSQDPLIAEYRYALLEAFEDVFGLQLQTASDDQKQRLLSSSQQAVLHSSSKG